MSTIKTKIRKEMRQRRLALSPETHQLTSQKICNALMARPEYKSANVIATYLPCQNEVDSKTLIDAAWAAHKTICLPVITDYQKKKMMFYTHTAKAPLIDNQYQILEPDTKQQTPLDSTDIDLLITPLIAFDQEGNRLGQGGGYYDRFLSQYLNAKQKPIIAGIAYDFQEISNIPVDPWDIPLDFIIS